MTNVLNKTQDAVWEVTIFNKDKKIIKKAKVRANTGGAATGALKKRHWGEAWVNDYFEAEAVKIQDGDYPTYKVEYSLPTDKVGINFKGSITQEARNKPDAILNVFRTFKNKIDTRFYTTKWTAQQQIAIIDNKTRKKVGFINAFKITNTNDAVKMPIFEFQISQGNRTFGQMRVKAKTEKEAIDKLKPYVKKEYLKERKNTNPAVKAQNERDFQNLKFKLVNKIDENSKEAVSYGFTPKGGGELKVRLSADDIAKTYTLKLRADEIDLLGTESGKTAILTRAKQRFLSETKKHATKLQILGVKK